MGAHTKIEWAHHTFNPWWGCVEQGPACDHCYARDFSRRVGFDVWGVDKPRRFFGDQHWSAPRRWNAAAKAAGERHRVFVASMGDVLERRPDLVAPRARLWDLITECDGLDWLLLTKLPWHFARMVPAEWLVEGGWPPHVWPGTTVENRRELHRRVPRLLRLPSLQKFLSMEPLLEDVAGPPGSDARAVFTACLASGFVDAPHTDCLTWVISGGESGPRARPTLPAWHRHVRDACIDYRVAYHFKQWGEWAPGEAAETPVLRTERVTSWDAGAGWQFGTLTPRQSEELHADDAPDLYRLGKKHSGRRLDGETWDQVPPEVRW